MASLATNTVLSRTVVKRVGNTSCRLLCLRSLCQASHSLQHLSGRLLPQDRLPSFTSEQARQVLSIAEAERFPAEYIAAYQLIVAYAVRSGDLQRLVSPLMQLESFSAQRVAVQCAILT